MEKGWFRMDFEGMIGENVELYFICVDILLIVIVF